MPFKFIKKEFNKARQIISEKVGNAKPTEFSEEFKKLESTFNGYHDLFVSLSKDIKYMLYPSLTYKLFTKTANKFMNANDKFPYPYPEYILSVNCRRFCKELNELPISQVLWEFSETYKMIVDYKNDLEKVLRQHFLKPLKDVRKNKIELILKSRKKLESYRLEYDSLKSQYSSNPKLQNDFTIAEEKFTTKTQEVYQEMHDFMISEDRLLPALLKLTQALTKYEQQCGKEFQDLCLRIETQKQTVFGEIEPPVDIKSTAIILKDDNKNALNDLETKPCCKVLYSFYGSEKNDLAIIAGEIIDLLEDHDGQWFLGECNGKRGYFPGNHVEVIVPLP